MYSIKNVFLNFPFVGEDILLTYAKNSNVKSIEWRITMADINHKIPNVMPDAMIEPITDSELIVAKLKHDGELNKHATDNKLIYNRNKEV